MQPQSTAQSAAPQVPAPTDSAATATSPAQSLTPVQVVSAADGDSLRVRIDGREVVVRYLGIDSADGGPAHGAARKANELLTSNKLVFLEQDLSDADKYGRLLRYVWLEDGRLLNQELVRLGCAASASKEPDTKYEERLLRAQSAAVEAKRTCSSLDIVVSSGPAVITPAAPTLTPTPTVTPQPTAVTRSSGGKKTGAVNTTANLRAGPSTEYEIVGRAFTGDAVQIAGCNETCDWFQLDSRQWVLAELVTVAAAPPAAAPTSARVVNVSAAAPGKRAGIWCRHRRPAQRTRESWRRRGCCWRAR